MLTRDRGFSFFEVIIVVLVLGLLSTLAITGYRSYIERARAAEILAKYDAIKVGMEADADNLSTANCADLDAGVEEANLKVDGVRMSINFQAVADNPLLGYRPVLVVCARNDKQGTLGVGIAGAAHRELAQSEAVEQGAIVTDSLVTFAAPLSRDNQAVCFVPTGSSLTACGDPVAVPTAAAVKAPPVPTAAAVVAPARQDIKVPKLRAFVMKFSGTDTYVRPAGRKLSTGGDLDAFTLDISFIGDGNIPAASGGAGPVMFNYGDGSNAHNGISLWNPRSLTVAVQNRNYDTGLNVVDGNTHRVTVAWDSKTGVLSVYDNGQLVKSFADVSQGKAIAGGGNMVLAHKDNGGGSYSAGEAFAGQIFGAALARGSVTSGEAVTPLNQLASAQGNLLIDMRVNQGSGEIVDATGRHRLETGGVTAAETGVEGNLVNPGS